MRSGLADRGHRDAIQPTPTIPVQTAPSRLPGPQPQPKAPPGWPEGVLDGALTLHRRADLRYPGHRPCGRARAPAGPLRQRLLPLGTAGRARGSPTGSAPARGRPASLPHRRPRIPEPRAWRLSGALRGHRLEPGRRAAHRLVRPPAHRFRPRDRRIGDPAPALPGRLYAGRRGRLRGREQGPRRRPPRLHGGRRHHVREVRARRLARSRRRREADRALGRELAHELDGVSRRASRESRRSSATTTVRRSSPSPRSSSSSTSAASPASPTVRSKATRPPGRPTGSGSSRRTGSRPSSTASSGRAARSRGRSAAAALAWRPD